MNHPLLFFFILSFTHFRSLHPKRLAQNYSTKQQTFNTPNSLIVKGSALTSPWLKKKHIVVTTPPSRLPLHRKTQDKRGREQTKDSERSFLIWCYKSIFDRTERQVTWGRLHKWRTSSSSHRSAGTHRSHKNTPGRPFLMTTTWTHTSRQTGGVQ